MRQEYEITLQPLPGVPVERALPLRQRLWQQGWLRKGLILIVLALLWEAAARYQGLYAGIPEISVSPAPVPPRAHPGR